MNSLLSLLLLWNHMHIHITNLQEGLPLLTSIIENSYINEESTKDGDMYECELCEWKVEKDGALIS